MTAPQILVREEDKKGSGRRLLPPAPDYGWYLLGWVGFAFLVVGVADLALTWVPTHFGTATWEFGTVARSFDNLPVTTLGLALLLGGAVARGYALGVRVMGVVFVVAAVLVLAAGILYATNIPLALKSVADPVAITGLKKAIAKTVIQWGVYTLVYGVVGIGGLRHRPRVS